jgi:hypothetical protein
MLRTIAVTAARGSPKETRRGRRRRRRRGQEGSLEGLELQAWVVGHRNTAGLKPVAFKYMITSGTTGPPCSLPAPASASASGGPPPPPPPPPSL